MHFSTHMHNQTLKFNIYIFYTHYANGENPYSWERATVVEIKFSTLNASAQKDARFQL